MRSVFNCYFPISFRASVVAGLRLEKGRLEPRIALVSAGEKILFTVDEWQSFWSKKNELRFFFFGLFFGITFNLPKHEVLFSDEGEKQIVLKSKTTWNTIRLSEVEFNKLIHLKNCIHNHIHSIIETNDFLNHQIKEIITDLSVVVKGKMIELSSQKDAPLFDSRDITHLVREYLPSDKYIYELKTVYEDFFVREINSQVNK